MNNRVRKKLFSLTGNLKSLKRIWNSIPWNLRNIKTFDGTIPKEKTPGGTKGDDIKVLVTGTGRSCTTWVAQIVKTCGRFNWQGLPVEDREVLRRPSLKKRYASKLVCDHESFSESSLRQFFKKNPLARVVWCFKHPVSNVMSKIVRGQPHSKGGDKMGEVVSEDGNFESATKAVLRSYSLYKSALEIDKGRVLRIRLEDLILTPEVCCRSLSNFLRVSLDEIDIHAFSNTPNHFHKHRYGESVDKDQAEVYKNWDTAYEGFFKDRGEEIKKAAGDLEETIEGLGYEV